jgi:hypothetical protein
MYLNLNSAFVRFSQINVFSTQKIDLKFSLSPDLKNELFKNQIVNNLAPVEIEIVSQVTNIVTQPTLYNLNFSSISIPLQFGIKEKYSPRIINENYIFPKGTSSLPLVYDAGSSFLNYEDTIEVSYLPFNLESDSLFVSFDLEVGIKNFPATFQKKKLSFVILRNDYSAINPAITFNTPFSGVTASEELKEEIQNELEVKTNTEEKRILQQEKLKQIEVEKIITKENEALEVERSLKEAEEEEKRKSLILYSLSFFGFAIIIFGLMRKGN